MPEPQEDTIHPTDKTSKILQFLSLPTKEHKKEKIRPLTKIVIRRLPPRLTKELFLAEFSLPANDYLYFVRGDLNLGNNAYSRAYVNFSNVDDIFSFKDKYDDYPMQDEQGREYHAVVEWAPVQRVPKKTSQKKSAKLGTIESDSKYIDFLEKLEQEKNNPGSNAASEYFMETDSVSTKEVKVTTTPLLEYIKLKRQQKIDIRNENRTKKREVEKEKRKKDEEMRRLEKLRRDKEKTPQKIEVKEEKNYEVNKDSAKLQSRESSDKKKSDSKPLKSGIEKQPRDEKFEKRTPKNNRKSETHDSNLKSKAEERNSKTAMNRKTLSAAPVCVESDSRVSPPEPPTIKTASVASDMKRDLPRGTETKSKFRYSEQRNRDREVRNQKTTTSETKTALPDNQPAVNEEEKKEKEKNISRQSTQETSDGSLDGDESRADGPGSRAGDRKDPRTERRIRNKDRPSMQIYRPGMGKFSKQRMEQKKDDVDATEEKKEANSHEAAKSDEAQTSNKTDRRRKDENIKPFRNTKILDNAALRTDNKHEVNKKTDKDSNCASAEVVIDKRENAETSKQTTVDANGRQCDDTIKGEASVVIKEAPGTRVINSKMIVKENIYESKELAVVSQGDAARETNSPNQEELILIAESKKTVLIAQEEATQKGRESNEADEAYSPNMNEKLTFDSRETAEIYEVGATEKAHLLDTKEELTVELNEIVDIHKEGVPGETNSPNLKEKFILESKETADIWEGIAPAKTESDDSKATVEISHEVTQETTSSDQKKKLTVEAKQETEISEGVVPETFYSSNPNETLTGESNETAETLHCVSPVKTDVTTNIRSSTDKLTSDSGEIMKCTSRADEIINSISDCEGVRKTSSEAFDSDNVEDSTLSDVESRVTRVSPRKQDNLEEDIETESHVKENVRLYHLSEATAQEQSICHKSDSIENTSQTCLMNQEVSIEDSFNKTDDDNASCTVQEVSMPQNNLENQDHSEIQQGTVEMVQVSREDPVNEPGNLFEISEESCQKSKLNESQPENINKVTVKVESGE